MENLMIVERDGGKREKPFKKSILCAYSSAMFPINCVNKTFTKFLVFTWPVERMFHG